MWWYPDESYDDVRAEVEEVVAAVARTDPWLREHPPRLTWKLGSIYFPPLDVPLDHPGGQHARRLPATTSASIRRPRASAPRPTSPGTASASCRGSSAGRARSGPVPRRRRVPRHGAAPARVAGLRADARRVVRVDARCAPSSTRWSARSTSSTWRRPSPREGEVLIRVERAGICGSDVQGVATSSPRRAPPLIMGHELVGEVIAAAAGGEALVGRRVAVNPQVPCGVCLSCRSGLGEHLPAPRARRRHAARAASASSSRCRCAASTSSTTGSTPTRGARRAASPPASTRSGSSPLALPGTVVVLGAGTIGMLAASSPACSAPAGSSSARRTRSAARGRLRSRTRSSSRTGSSTPWARPAPTSSSTRSAPTRRGPRPSRCCGPGGCALWLGMHDMEATIPAFDLVVREQSIRGSFAYTNADFARAVELLAEQPDAFRLPTRTCSLEEGADRVHGARRRRRRAGSSRRRWRRR